MLTYSLDNKAKGSIYEYLYACIRDDIISGRLAPGFKLPSKRTFAKNHGISVITVENAYAQLSAEGYIYSIPKKGFYVSEINTGIPVKPKAAPVETAPEKESESRYIDLISNHTPKTNFPFSIWAKLMREVLTEGSERVLTVPPSGGVIQLRTAIAKHLYAFRGICVSPEQIIVGAGSEYLYGLIVQLLGRDKVYGLENPCSIKIPSIYKSLNVKINYLALDPEGIIMDRTKLNKTDIIQISPSHHFPTGIVTSISRRYDLLQWANETGEHYIIEDDYDSEFRLQGKPIPSLFSIDSTDRVIYFNTFTKSLASTIRISYMVLPRPLLKKFHETLGFYSCTVSNFEQYTLAHFIQEGYLDRHINRMRNHYRTIRDTLIEQLKNSPLGGKITVLHEDAGLHFLLKIDTSIPDEKLKEKARKNGILIAFLSDYTIKQDSDSNVYEHIAVINYSGMTSEEVISSTVLSLEECLR